MVWKEGTNGVLEKSHRLAVLRQPDYPVVLSLGETEEPNDAAKRGDDIISALPPPALTFLRTFQ